MREVLFNRKLPKIASTPTTTVSIRIGHRSSSNISSSPDVNPFEWKSADLGIEVATTPPTSWYTEGIITIQIPNIVQPCAAKVEAMFYNLRNERRSGLRNKSISTTPTLLFSILLQLSLLITPLLTPFIISFLTLLPSILTTTVLY